MKLKQFKFNPFQENTYLLFDDSGECIIIDAGCSSPEEERELESFINENNLKPVRSIYTHLHFDHVFGSPFLLRKYGLKPEAHVGDEFFYKDTKKLALERLGMHMQEDVPAIGTYLEEGDLEFGNSKLKLIHIPGHSPGSLVVYSSDCRFAIVGDVIFQGSVGRTDLWGGNHELLIHGIKSKLMTLPDETILYSGHGSKTTVGQEKNFNSFLN